MMEEDTSAGGDVEQAVPSPDPQKHPTDDPNKKWKVLSLSTFLVVVIVLSIALGTTLGGSGGMDTTPSNNGVNPEQEDVTDTTTNPTEDNGATTPDKDETIAPQVFKAQFLESKGPILTKPVRVIDPTVANGYESCDDLREDMLNALKFYANSVILREMNNDWFSTYKNCDPNRQPQWDYVLESVADVAFDAPEMAATVADEASSKSEATAFTGAADGGATAEKEDSFETNNQVEGVDEADIVKSDGEFVYAAYGDLLYAWPAEDGTKGISITTMPYEDFTESECSYNPFTKPVSSPVVDIAVEEPAVEDITIEFSEKTGELEEKPSAAAGFAGDAAEPDQASSASSSSNSVQAVTVSSRSEGVRRHRKGLSIAGPYIWRPCRKPKPRIVSLLLEGKRLTAIVAEDNWRGNLRESNQIINDYTKLTIRVYDVSEIPLNGDPLNLLAEKVIKGNYDSARSADNIGFVITTSSVNKWMFDNDLYRHHPQYCGLNSTEYSALAAETAVNKTEDFLDQMMEEMQLQLDGSCGSIFKVSAMQSGDSDEDTTNGDMLSQFVQVLSFNMASDFENFAATNEAGKPEVSTSVSGAFSSGYLNNVYASSNFVATLNGGSRYNAVSKRWDSSTFILGFDMSGADPKPLAYAEVPGQSDNQYATDLYDGHLRIVTEQTDWSNRESRTLNKLFVLKVPGQGEGQQMIRVGETGHLGKPNEEVKAVRFIGPSAYIVTFENTDPFYIYDLSDPTNPTKVGELEIPGFSSYLHPITLEGVPLLLGVGEHVDPKSLRRVGLKISLFDVSDPSSPKENAVFIDEDAYSSAGNDFKAFRFLTLSKKLILPKNKWTGSDHGNFDGFTVYDVKLGEVTPSFEIQHANSYDMRHGCWYNAYMPARSFVFQSKLTTILSHTVISTALENGKELWNITLGDVADKECSPYFWW